MPALTINLPAAIPHDDRYTHRVVLDPAKMTVSLVSFRIGRVPAAVEAKRVITVGVTPTSSYDLARVRAVLLASQDALNELAALHTLAGKVGGFRDEARALALIAPLIAAIVGCGTPWHD